MGRLAENLEVLEERIDRACRSVGRRRSEVTLVAVSKTRPAESLLEAYEAGVRDFGESRLQEALTKLAALPTDVRWHFVGRLQSNKARRVAEGFQVLHTLENEGQVREVQKAGRKVDGLVEVNIAEEGQKSGLFEGDLDGFVKNLIECPQVRFRGLMTIGPALDDPEAMRGTFRRLRELNVRVGGEWLSMGMSHDFEVAIQEGATHVRVGTALFGARAG